MFITFEGIDGSGKTTQAVKLCSYLKAQGYSVSLLREPGSTPIGEKVRDIIQKQGATKSVRAELMLFLAARAELVQMVIKPSLERGEIIICDRFGDSSVAYQGYGRDGQVEVIKTLTDYAAYGIKPNLTILLDIDVREAHQRIVQRQIGSATTLSEFELKELDFHERVRSGYLELAKENQERWLTIDGSSSPDDTQAKVRTVAWAKLANRFAP